MPTALLSVSDKTGLVPFAEGLASRGYDLVASGGTAKKLRAAGLTVLEVEDLTGFPHLLDGRVKTLHPAVHAGILARRDAAHLGELEALGMRTIDVVVCNLYPFVETISREDVSFDGAIEQIDIGGVTLLRAAAKNCAHVSVVCDPSDYEPVLAELDSPSDDLRRKLARKAFAHTAAYDAAISGWFADITDDDETPLPARLSPIGERSMVLRYGENPHQSAALYRPDGGELPFAVLQGKELSYNNLVDLDGAWTAIDPFTDPVCAIVKHTNPCGLAVGTDLVDAYRKAHASDPVSAFGSIIAVNGTVDEAFVDALGKLFVEVLAAPDFTPGALERLARRKKNCRVVRIDLAAGHGLQIRTIRGGWLAQTPDVLDSDPAGWTVATKVRPTPEQMVDLQHAWRAARAVKSNAIVIVKDLATVGVGAGQMNRLESVRIAGSMAGEKAQGAVLASDAFFPFADGLEAAVAVGVAAVVQPGGSIRDDEVIEAADRLGVAMVFTGVRHFRH
ncbi:MAG: bifunctional phosphoribosylaminoimidazolecarboxamide formyltransferase/IMP cyclohydrolase [Myxococcales bacterium]|nr:bifunctional phosphoribosylaminoimidazolecarboxamide formyltransferase/IMP cyclohydrolase [Myxococcales bacterium]MCB9671269.1 bifunctional phosphoribosylaminoimidazolecarboxamide formyltransferase/IMP cyclohydrolase [Alphaproteobacteria bacterium]